MDQKTEILELIKTQGVLPLFFYKDAEVSIEVLRALYQSGIRTVEYTNRGEAALNNFRKMRAVLDSELKGMYLGVGTIKKPHRPLLMLALITSSARDWWKTPPAWLMPTRCFGFRAA